MTQQKSAATYHARKRIRERLGLEFDDNVWAQIAANARAGLYPSQRPRKVPKHRGVTTHRTRSPIYMVPVGNLEEGWGWLVPMAINVDLLLVVTVLPPPKGMAQYPSVLDPV